MIQHRPGKHHTMLCLDCKIIEESSGEKPTEISCSVCSTENVESFHSNWCQPFSVEELRTAQLGDPDVTVIIGWQEALLERPLRSDIALRGASVCILRLWSQWKRLKLVDGVLYREYFPDNNDDRIPALQFVVPQSLQESVLKSVHAEVSGGHLGVERTLSKLRL